MSTTHRLAPGLSPPVLILLAALAAPRVILHDLGLIGEGTFVNALFVFVPPLVWIAVVLGRRAPNPFVTLLVVGALYGLMLVIGHQVLWNVAWEGEPPRLGGSLSALPPLAHEVITRGAAVVSGLVTGTVVGALAGLVALAGSRILPERAGTP